MSNRFRLGHIERYVLASSLVGVAAALGVISFVIVLIDFVELSRTVGVRARDASVLDVFGLAALQSPAVILLLLPFAFLFGVLRFIVPVSGVLNQADVFKDFAHIALGLTLGLAIAFTTTPATKAVKIAWWLIPSALTVLEVVAFFARHK